MISYLKDSEWKTIKSVEKKEIICMFIAKILVNMPGLFNSEAKTLIFKEKTLSINV